MKIVIRLFTAIVAGVLLAPSVGRADGSTAALPVLLGAASLGDDGSSSGREADQLLREARQAMLQGKYDVAEANISRAEALNPKYSIFHIGDTPKKARADLKRQLAQEARRANKTSAPKADDPFQARAPEQPSAAKQNNSGAEQHSGAEQNPGAKMPTNAEIPSAPQARPDDQPSLPSSPPMRAPQALQRQQLDMPSRVAAPSTNSTSTAAAADQVTAQIHTQARAQSDTLLLDARRALAHGDVQAATVKLEQAKGLAASYSPMDDSPDKVAALMEKVASLNAAGDPKSEEQARRRVELLMEQAEGLARWRDWDTAQQLAVQAQQVPVRYAPAEGRPEDLLRRIAQARQNPEPAQLSLDPAATQLTQQNDTRGATGPGDRVDATAKQRALQAVAQARRALAAGDPATAEKIARGAEPLVPDTAFGPDEDRPSLVLLDIDRARRAGGHSGVVSASGTADHPAATRALYDPETDQSRTIQATAAGPAPAQRGALRPRPMIAPPPLPAGSGAPTPDNGTGEAMRWYRKGVEAISQSKTDEALIAFRRAYAFQAELDPPTRQQLHDHLQILGEPIDRSMEENATAESPVQVAAGNSPIPSQLMNPEAARVAQIPVDSAPPAPIADDETPAQPNQDEDASNLTGQALARQVTAEVARQQSLAKEMREKQPKQALELLERTRNMVSSVSALDPAAREQLDRRLVRSVDELKQYIAQNAPQIELDEQNRKVEEEVDRRRKQKVEVQEKLAYLVDDFNKLVDEQRYAEAAVLAKRATELDPENPVVTQLSIMSKQLQRVAEQDALYADKEQAVYDAMYDMDKAATPFTGPIAFPDVKTWDRLTKNRSRLKAEGSMRRSPKEIEIEKRLSTPVSLKFQQRPLAEVVAYLGKIAQVPVYLDPEGLRAEGVASDTPVTIDLTQDISLKSALRLILEPLRLAYVIQDEVLKITSEDMQRGQLYAVTYPVADLVIPIPNFVPDGREGINAALREAYSRMGFGGAAGGGFSNSGPLAVLAGDQGAGGSNAKINPALLAQMHAAGIPIGSGGPPQSGTPQGNPFGPGGLGGGAQADFDSLIELIRSTVGPPEIWDDMGGQGTIEGFETNLSLVVYQTQEKHEEIADLLAQLRRLQDLQVTIEVRFITLNDTFFERIGVDFDFDLQTNTPNVTPVVDADGAAVPFEFNNTGPSSVVGLGPGGIPTNANQIQFRQDSFGGAVPNIPGFVFDPTTAATFGFAILSDIEAFFLIQAAQGDSRSNILQAPKVTLFNGQLASVSDVTQRPFVTQIIPVVGDFAAAQQPVIVVLSEGTSLTVQAVVSSDRRFVRLTIVPFFSTIGDVDTFTFTGSRTTISKSADSQKGDDESSESTDDTEITEGTTVQLPTFSFTAVSTTVNVPDGGTVLLGGVKRLNEGRNEFGVPVLSKIPYINRLFRNVGIARTTNSLMMMVTPRIIIQEEEEENLLGTAPP